MRTGLIALLQGDPAGLPSGYLLDDVVLEGSYPRTVVSILFRDAQRPTCLFGYRFGTFWDEVENEAASREADWTAVDPESWPTYIWAALREALVDVPKDCDRNGITWLVEPLEGLSSAARRVSWAVWAPTWIPQEWRFAGVSYMKETLSGTPDRIWIGYAHDSPASMPGTTLVETPRQLWNVDPAEFNEYPSDGGVLHVRRTDLPWKAWTTRGATHVWFLTERKTEELLRVAESLEQVLTGEEAR